jgi:competence protein ComEC
LSRHPFLRFVVPLACGILCGDARFFQGRLPLFSPARLLLFAVVFLLALLILQILSNYRPFQWLFGTLTALFCFGFGWGLADIALQRILFPFPDRMTVYQGTVMQKPVPKPKSMACHTRIDDHNFILYLPRDSASAALQPGDELLVYARLQLPRNDDTSDGFDYRRYLLRQGYSGTAYAGRWQLVGHTSRHSFAQRCAYWREQVVNSYRRNGIEGTNLAVLSALTLGEKEALDRDLRETYSVAGVSHVLAISGLHVGILYALFLFLFSWGWRRWLRVRYVAVALSLPALWGFALLTGFSPSVVRSVTFFSLLGLASLQSDTLPTLNGVAVTAFIMLCIRPLWLFDVGFQLSFAAVTAILLFQPWLYGLWDVRPRPLRYVWGLLTLSVSAQVGTAPLVIYYFHRFSTHFLFSNLLIVPLITLVLYAAVLLLLCTPFPALQTYIAPIINGALDVQHGFLHRIVQLPAASVDGLRLNGYEVMAIYLLLLAVGYRCYTAMLSKNLR